jgi:hypothetical protein
LRDDTSLVMVDILPPGKTFAEAIHAVSLRSKLSAAAASAAAHGGDGGGGGGGCGCFGGSAAPPLPPPPPPSPAITSPLAAAAAAERGAAPPTPSSSSAAAVGHLEVLTDLDVAAVMGLMPGAQPLMPGWYDEYVGEHLFNLAVSPGLRWGVRCDWAGLGWDVVAAMVFGLGAIGSYGFRLSCLRAAELQQPWCCA